MAKLRDYQAKAIAEIFANIRCGMSNNILHLPPGGGKTECAIAVILDCIKNDFPCVVVVRGRELVKNFSHRLDKYKIDHSVYMAGSPRLSARKLIQVASVDTLSARSKYPYADQECLVILDEQHKNYDKVYENYPKAKFIGLSGTPFSDESNRYYHAAVSPIEAYELRDKGVLVDFKIYCPNMVS